MIKAQCVNFFISVITIILILCPGVGLAANQEEEIHARGYFYFEPIFGTKVTGDNRTVDIGRGWVVGFGMRVGPNEYLGIGFDVFMGNQEREVQETGGHDDSAWTKSFRSKNGDVLGANVNADIGISLGILRPFITGGVGFFSYRCKQPSNVIYVNYNPYTGSEIMKDTHLSYNAGVGISMGFWSGGECTGGELTLLARNTWTKLKGTDKSALMPSIQIAFGFDF